MTDPDRRRFLTAAVPLLLLPAASPAPPARPHPTPAAGAKDEKKEGEDEDVTPTEDLMREHGVLKRVLLVYDEVRRRLAAGTDVPPDAVVDAAGIIRAFIEEYHEELEEKELFPRFRAHHTLVELVDVLETQHKAGRVVTERILSLARGSLKTEDERKQLSSALQQFTRMYEPHEAREDTVLFPAFRKLVSAHEYDALGDAFEAEERRKLGKDGFEGMVEKVGGIERRLGIYDLAQFTPR